MSELPDSPRVIAEANDYASLQRALRVRAEELAISGETIEELGFLPKGYASKILAQRPIRRLGAATMGDMLRALGLKLLVVEDAAGLARTLENARKRNEHRVTKLGAAKDDLVVIKFRQSFLRSIARLGGQKRAANLSEQQRKRIAKHASRARWGKGKGETKCP